VLRSFEDFVNRPANDKIIYDQRQKIARSENSPVRSALYFHWDRFSAFGCHYKFPPTSPLIFLLNKGSEESREAKSPRCKSFQHAFSNSSVGSFMSPLVELTKTWLPTQPLIYLFNKGDMLGRPNHRGVSLFYTIFRTAVCVILFPQGFNLTAQRHNHVNWKKAYKLHSAWSYQTSLVGDQTRTEPAAGPNSGTLRYHVRRFYLHLMVFWWFYWSRYFQNSNFVSFATPPGRYKEENSEKFLLQKWSLFSFKWVSKSHTDKMHTTSRLTPW